MTTAQVPDSDHIARLCKGTWVDNEIVQPAAFELRPQETYLSVRWLEQLDSVQDKAIEEIRKVYAGLFDITTTWRVATLNVGHCCTAVAAAGLSILVTHLPEPDDPSHSGIEGIDENDQDVISEILSECVERVVPAKV